MADVIDFQGMHRPDLRKHWIFVSGIEETGQRARLPPRWWKCRSWEGSVTGSCSFSRSRFSFFFFFFYTRYVWIYVVRINLSRPLHLAEGRNDAMFRVWRCLRRTMLRFWNNFSIWFYFAFEDFELFSSNCEEIIELKKWFSLI